MIMNSDKVDSSNGEVDDDQYDKGGGMKDENNTVRDCVVNKEWCMTHGCIAKAIKVSGQKWIWKERKKEWGFVSINTPKIICNSKKKVSKYSCTVA